LQETTSHFEHTNTCVVLFWSEKPQANKRSWQASYVTHTEHSKGPRSLDKR